MHELSIAMSIVEIAESYAEREKAGKVIEMEIEVGDLSGVVVEALEFALQEAIQDTRCAGASWNIIRIHPLGRCPQCGKENEVESPFNPCPDCGEYGLEMIRGKELRVRSIVVEDGEMTAPG